MNHFESVMQERSNFIPLANAIADKGWAGEAELVLSRVGYNTFRAESFDTLCDLHGFLELKGRALRSTAFNDPDHYSVYAIFDEGELSRDELQDRMFSAGQLRAVDP